MKLTDVIKILNLNDKFYDSDDSTKLTAINNTFSVFEYETTLLDASPNTLNIGVELYKTKSYKEVQDILYASGYTEEEIISIFNYTLYDFEVDFIPSLSYLSEFATKKVIFGILFEHEIHKQIVGTFNLDIPLKAYYNNDLLTYQSVNNSLSVISTYRVQDTTYTLPSMSFSPTVTYLLSEVIP